MSMPYDVMGEACPSRAVLRRVGARWSIFVIYALHEGPMRFIQLRDHIGGVKNKVLTETLRALLQDGLIQRVAKGDNNSLEVEYSLTDLGKSLWTPLQAMRHWAEIHTDEILDTRANYDASHTVECDI